MWYIICQKNQAPAGAHDQHNVLLAPSFLNIREGRSLFFACIHTTISKKKQRTQYFSLSLLRFLDHMYLCVLENMTTLRAWLLASKVSSFCFPYFTNVVQLLCSLSAWLHLNCVFQLYRMYNGDETNCRIAHNLGILPMNSNCFNSNKNNNVFERRVSVCLYAIISLIEWMSKTPTIVFVKRISI